jgi:TonB family protein
MAAIAPQHPHYFFSADFGNLFPQMVTVSVIAHVLALAAFIFVPALLPHAPAPLPKTVEVELVNNLPKGPGMGPMAPDRTQEAARRQNTLPEMQRKQKVTTPDDVKLTKDRINPTNRLSAQDRQRMSAVEMLREKRAFMETTGGGGTATASTTGVLGIYLAKLQSQILSAWSLPGGLSDANMQKIVKIRIYLSPQGVVIKQVTTQASGFDPLDRSCASAILKATPLPPPPTLLADDLATKGITIRFHPLDKQH